MIKQELPIDFIELISTITNKRAKIVIDHIIEYGFITTQDLETTYGYSHPPRAARDVREAGIPLETFNVKSNEGKSIAAYKFGDLTKIQHNRSAGRQIFSKKFKNQLYILCNGRCAICNGQFEERYLQIDHKIPYQIGGDVDSFKRILAHYMLLCASCNRAKSWSCEHCENWINKQDAELCLKCYWGNPDNYDHIALKEIRKLELVWQDGEVPFFEDMKKKAIDAHLELPKFVKSIIVQHLKQTDI
jgi:hypothetical protein